MRQKQNWIRWGMTAIAALLLLFTAAGPRGGSPRPQGSDSPQEARAPVAHPYCVAASQSFCPSASGSPNRRSGGPVDVL
jgi:hypothetical protein